MIQRGVFAWALGVALLACAGLGIAQAQQPPEFVREGEAAARAAAEVEAEVEAALKPHADAHGEHGHGDHHVHIGMADVSDDPAEFKSDLAIYTFVVFVLLMLILTKFGWKPIMDGLEKRERSVAENIEAAERVGSEARRMLAEYEAKLASAADEVRAMLEEARRDAEHTKQQIVAEARDEAAAERARALRDVDTAKDQALKEIAEASARQAVDLAAKILRVQITPADHSRLIQEAMQQFPSKN